MKAKTRPLLSLIAAAGAALLLGFGPVPAIADDPMLFPPPATADGDHTAPKLLCRVEPAYPAEVRNETAERRVFVAFLVDGNGRVQRASAMFGPPEPFAKAALAAVEQWTFAPATLRGHPVWTQMTVALYFKPPSAAEKN